MLHALAVTFPAYLLEAKKQTVTVLSVTSKCLTLLIQSGELNYSPNLDRLPLIDFT